MSAMEGHMLTLKGLTGHTSALEGLTGHTPALEGVGRHYKVSFKVSAFGRTASPAQLLWPTGFLCGWSVGLEFLAGQLA